jgi:outer membrane protein assembly factor BamD (BamD/ComL family)
MDLTRDEFIKSYEEFLKQYPTASEEDYIDYLEITYD